MKYTLLTGLLALALVSCENPADATTDATVGQTQAVAQASASAQTYLFTEASSFAFTGSKVTGSHSGGFKQLSGEFKLENGQPVSGSFTIDMTSIFSDHEKLTAHLSNADFFNIPQHPTATFEVTEFGAVQDGGLSVSGNLTMVGQTHNISFPATVTQADDLITIEAEFDINRQDWGISYPGRKDDLIRDEVVIDFTLVAQAQ